MRKQSKIKVTVTSDQPVPTKLQQGFTEALTHGQTVSQQTGEIN